MLCLGIDTSEKKALVVSDGKEIQTLSNIGGITVSKNGQKIATWGRVGNNLVFYINGVEQAHYTDLSGSLSISDISFSIDAKRYGYVLNDKTTGSNKVFIDGGEQQYQGKGLKFAPQGDQFAYIGNSNSKSFMVVNGVKQKEYLSINDRSDMFGNQLFIWSPDGQRVAYAGQLSQTTPNGGVYANGEYAIVVDNKELVNGVEIVGTLKFNPDSKRFAYVVSRQNAVIEVNVDGKSLTNSPGNIITQSKGLYFSPDSKRFLYVYDGFLNEYTGTSSKKHNSQPGSISTVVFSPDSKRLAYTITRNKGASAISLDGTEYKAYSSSRIPIFSPDSKHIAFWQGDVDYHAIQGYGYVSDLSQKSTVTLDLTKKITVNDPYSQFLEGYYIASPSRLFTYHYLHPDTFYSEILNTISFSDDGKFLKFNAIRGNEYWVIVLDTITGKEVIDKDTIIPTDVPMTPTITLPSPIPSPNLQMNSPSENNTKRASDINAILNAIGQYAADNKGVPPNGIDSSTRYIEKNGSSSNDADICTALVSSYIAALPVDPLTNNGTPITDCSTNYKTNYTVTRSASDNRITISAPGAELGQTISITR